MLRKIKWILLYLIFFVITFFIVATFIGASYYFSEFFNTKLNAHWWIAIMQYGELNSIEYFIYSYQQKFFFSLYLISVFIFSVVIYTSDNKGFWLFILSLIIFLFACLIGELAIVKNLQSLNLINKEQIEEVKIANFINEAVWFVRWYLCFSLFNFLISTISYFRKKDYWKAKESKIES